MRNEFTAAVERDRRWYVAYCPEIPGAKKTYTCPTHVDHEEMVLRRENVAGDIFYEFTFDFSVDMSCVKVSPL